MTEENENKDELVPEDAPESTPEAEGTEPVDQQERADEAATVAAEAAEEAAEAAEEAGTETAIAAAAEAEEAAEKAEAAAEAAAEKPKSEKSRKAREAEQAAEQAEEAADEAKKSARRVRGRRGREEKPQESRQPAAPVGLKVSAQAKYVRTSARKARLVCDHIRGKDVEQARAILAFTPREAAKAWAKLLESAVANAENNHDLVGEEMRIFSVHADEGPTLKRYRPRAMGRATRIRKRTSHLSITLISKES
jgi:ribosomal protein L22